MAVARTYTPSGEARTASLRPLCLGHPWKGAHVEEEGFSPSADPLCRYLEVCLPGDFKSCQDVTVEVITHMMSCKVCPHEGHSHFDFLLRDFRTPLLLELKASIWDTHSLFLQQLPGTAFSSLLSGNALKTQRDLCLANLSGSQFNQVDCQT